MLRTRISLVLIVGLSQNTVAKADVINVPADFPFIQSAIVAASDGDEVVVHPGTYIENISFDGKAITVRSLDPTDPGVVQSTIIDGSAASEEDVGGSVVAFGNDEASNSVLDGFTLTHGIGRRFPAGRVGGGIMCAASSPTIRNCIITNNTGRYGGGGIYCTGNGAPTITHCKIEFNRTDRNGGGISCSLTNSPTIDRCVIRNNVAGPSDQSFAGHGGGLSIVSFSNPKVRNCFISGNFASFSGGGVSMSGDCNPEFMNCVITHNTTRRGGGISTFSRCDPMIMNCTISQNIASESGGALYCTNDSEPVVQNSILWNNEAPIGPELHVAFFNLPTVLTMGHSDVAGGFDAAEVDDGSELLGLLGNIDLDPLFVNSVSADYRLLAGSPCIDAGDNAAVPPDVETDLNGSPRFADDLNTPDTGNPDGINPIVDMGAFEFGPCIDEDGDGQVTICHVPQGNPDNAHAITISVNASSSHVAHGDYCGLCGGDCNNNGIGDVEDIDDGTSMDCNGNEIPDECEPDCNENGQADSCDIAQSASQDCNGDHVPDECEEDCNGNNQQDACDILQGISLDCDGNGVPDECQADCNGNDQADSCDIAEGSSDDCNTNGVPDECEEFPSITEQPTDQVVEEGEFVFFSISADAILPQYQWRKDGAELSDTDRIFGSNSEVLLILDVQPGDAGSYDCVVTDGFGCMNTSDAATLTITTPCSNGVPLARSRRIRQ